MSDDRVSLFVVGDVLLDVMDADACLAPSRPLFATADFVIGNCEGVYSDAPQQSPSAKHVMVVPRERGARLGTAPFHVMTCAGNHMIDGGYAGLAETLALLHEQGIRTCGVGENLAEAGQPLLLEKSSVAIDLHAFGTVFPVGYEARDHAPGINPLRVNTFYTNPDPNFWEPGIAPLITTQAVPRDLQRMRQLLAASKKAGRRCVATFHWGYSSTFVSLQDYERDLAREAIAAGADVVLCHHHHSLRGIEYYEGKPIYYGLGTYIHHFAHVEFSEAKIARNKLDHGEYYVGPRDDYPLFPFHPDARMTGIATIDLSADASLQFGFIPAFIEPDGTTTPLTSDDPRQRIVFDYLEQISRHHQFSTSFKRSERAGYAWASICAGA